MEYSALTTTLITLIVSTIELVVCLACAILLWYKRKKMPDNSRLMLALGAAHCVITSLLKYVQILFSPTAHLYHEALSPASTKYGLLSTLLLLAYGVSVVKPEWFKSWKGVLGFLLPGFLMMAVFYSIPSYRILYSFEDVCLHIAEPNVWFRAFQYPFIVVYSLVLLFVQVNIRKTGVSSLWVRSYILGALMLLTLVSAFSLFHLLVFHYIHQVCVALFFAYWTYYELYERTYTAPLPSVNLVSDDNENNDAVRFRNFNEQVESRKLYTQVGLSRDDLCRMMGVDRTTFSRIIAEQSGCPNLAGYLNKKRMKYAVELMRQHPNYTLHAIMEDCGYTSKVTFNRVFKEAYGMTPSEYRSQIVTMV
ncbi:MAG: helix-turn-helix transcriptional regulator [Bacteroidaceae bacterium]|nr:helix-turn-helix transcriptional regulator [Bacteroidaceae bacterium]